MGQRPRFKRPRYNAKIGGFDVLMHFARAVGLSEPSADLRGDVHRLVQRQPSSLDRADVGMVQRRGRLGFLQESLLDRLVAGQVRRQELDGDLALQPRVLGRVDVPHAICAELGADRVRAEDGTWREEEEV